MGTADKRLNSVHLCLYTLTGDREPGSDTLQRGQQNPAGHKWNSNCLQLQAPPWL